MKKVVLSATFQKEVNLDQAIEISMFKLVSHPELKKEFKKEVDFGKSIQGSSFLNLKNRKIFLITGDVLYNRLWKRLRDEKARNI